MFLYRAQHKVMGVLNDAIVKNQDKDFKIHINDMIKQVPLRRKTVIKAVTSLNLKGYVNYGTATEHYTVGLTKLGLHAFATWEFIVLQQRAKWTVIRDAALVITNLSLATIAVYSVVKLNYDASETKREIQKLQVELKQANSRITSLQNQTIVPSNHSIPSPVHKAINQ
jgi:hypothetical protein